MYLYLNTADNKKIVLGLYKKDSYFFMTTKAKYQQSEKLLKTVHKLLTKHKTKIKYIKGIVCVNGPGGFTSLRIGVTTCNTLGYVLNIPIIAIEKENKLKDETVFKQALKKIKNRKKFKPILPYYGAEPNITLKKQNTSSFNHINLINI